MLSSLIFYFYLSLLIGSNFEDAKTILTAKILFFVGGTSNVKEYFQSIVNESQSYLWRMEISVMSVYYILVPTFLMNYSSIKLIFKRSIFKFPLSMHECNKLMHSIWMVLIVSGILYFYLLSKNLNPSNLLLNNVK